jgi:hypothetical protein
MPADLAREIEVYEGQIELKKAGKIEDKLFAETRLRRGSYGQRYDNGQRHDGLTQPCRFRLQPPRAPRPCGMRQACSASRSPLAV